MTEEFIGELLVPVRGRAGAHPAPIGAPQLPGKFLWREEEVGVADVLGAWKETSPCKSGSPERYLRRHWFKIKTTGGDTMTLYFERQARSSRDRKKRWWLYALSRGSPAGV